MAAPTCQTKTGVADAAAGAALQAVHSLQLHFRVFRGRIARRLEASAGQTRRLSKIIVALAVVVSTRACELGLVRRPEVDGKVDKLVEDRRAETRPKQSEQNVLRLDYHLRHHVVIPGRGKARFNRVVGEASAAEVV